MIQHCKTQIQCKWLGVNPYQGDGRPQQVDLLGSLILSYVQSLVVMLVACHSKLMFNQNLFTYERFYKCDVF